MSKDINSIMLQEVRRLRAEVNALKTLLGANGLVRHTKKHDDSIYSGKTTRSERDTLKKHLEELEEQFEKIQKIKPLPKAKNIFVIGQIVQLINTLLENKSKGQIQFIACREALSSIKKCEKEICQHKNKSYIWVRWPDNRMFSYYHSKLELMTEDALRPRIGKELSGKIGPWTFNVETGIWKKDGSDKEYTKEEFADIMYFEFHEYAKEEGETLIKLLKK